MEEFRIRGKVRRHHFEAGWLPVAELGDRKTLMVDVAERDLSGIEASDKGTRLVEITQWEGRERADG